MMMAARQRRYCLELGVGIKASDGLFAPTHLSVTDSELNTRCCAILDANCPHDLGGAHSGGNPEPSGKSCLLEF